MVSENSLFGPLDPAPDAGHTGAPPRKGFFTDTSVCIGCKACEVACKEWNAVPVDGMDLLGQSYDNTGGLTANSWRAVHFVEQPASVGRQSPAFLGLPTGLPSGPAAAEGAGRAGGGAAGGTEFLGMPGMDLPGRVGDGSGRTDFRWLMMSNVCKHCTHAACLDVCPTGSLFRTEVGTVVVQEDICNGCGYCIPACPYGVIDRREDDDRAWKCTLCYDRSGDGGTPACAQAGVPPSPILS